MRTNSLVIDLYELTMAQVYFKYSPDSQATFDLFIRSPKRPFYLAAGIDDCLNYLQDLRFSRNDIEYLKSLRTFDDEFISYLKKFRFKGQVWAVEEPEIVFPSEPIIRVTANLIEAQIIESFLLNTINCATTLATKAARIVLAACGKDVFDFSLRRTQGVDASLACARYSYLAGASGTSNVLAGSEYGIPVVGTMAHSFVMTFEREIESFLHFSRQFPSRTILLVDTYDVKNGVQAAIRVARFLKHKGIDIVGLRLDSGDLVNDARETRLMLDREGFIDTMLVASGDLDEYKIGQLVARHAPYDAFGVGTHMGCSSDAPFSDVIYKLVEIKNKGKKFIPTMKLSAGKATYPGRKQIFRFNDNAKIMVNDILALDCEKYSGKKILRKVMENGRRLYKEKTLNEKRRTCAEKLTALPEYLRAPDPKQEYAIKISPALASLTRDLSSEIEKRIQSRTLFIDIDTQYDFLNKKGALYINGSETVVKNAAQLTCYAQKHGILIVSTLDAHAKNDPEFKEFPPHCVKGSKGHKKLKTTLLANHKSLSPKKAYSIEELKKMAEKYPQLIIEKSAINVFSNPNLKPLIEVIFPDMIYVYGVATDYCVKEMVEGLVKNHHPLAIVSDAIKAINPSERDSLFARWKEMGVKFVKTSEVLDQLSQT